MHRFPKATRADYRRLNRLVWRPGGVYDAYTRSSWNASMPSFLLARAHSFRTLGHTWTLSFTVSVWRYGLDASVSFAPERLLDPKETERLQAAGFFADLAALLGQMGYDGLWVGTRSNGYCIRFLRSVSEIAPLQRRFETLDLTSPGRARGRRLNGTRLRSSIDELLRWGRKQDRSKWSLGCLELKTWSNESAGGIRWRIRRDVLLGPKSGCTWFCAWLPPKYTRVDWRRAQESGFFDRSARTFLRLRQKGCWRDDVFRFPERYAAEFWRPGRDPGVAWRDFQALLDYRLI